jgi:hypothetical protein
MPLDQNNVSRLGGLRLVRRDWLLITSIAVAVIGTSFGAPVWLTRSATLLAICLPWFRRAESNVLWYAATLALPAPQSIAVIRLTIADFFMLPVIISAVFGALRHGVRLPRSTMIRPFGVLLLVFALGTAVGYAQTGRLTGYVLFSKDAGLLFQIAAFVMMIQFAKTRDDVVRLARWFVVGVSLSNAFALLAVLAALAGFDNYAFLLGNSRLYGWMNNPSITGGLLLVAAMIEFSLLAIPAAPGEHRVWRWVNLWVLGGSIALTLSRSAWASMAAASVTLLALLLSVDLLRQNRRLPYLTCLAIWVLLPFLALGRVAGANIGLRISPSERAAELQNQLVSRCLANPAVDICDDVVMPGGPAEKKRPAATPAPSIIKPLGWTGTDAVMTNPRGLTDRLGIIFKAWEMYTAHGTSLVLGIGLGTFFATSGPIFGVPLIIHNTFAWFLIEFGPLGFLVLAWLWLQTTRNLLAAIRTPDDSRYLAMGVLAAFAGLTIFCVLNEGFYQRQLWLVFALADRLRFLGSRSPVPA